MSDIQNLSYIKKLSDVHGVVGDFMDDIQYHVFPSIRDSELKKEVISGFPRIWRKVQENEKALKRRIIELSNPPEA